MDKEFTIDIHGEQIVFTVEDYEPPIPAYVCRDPIDSTPPDPGSMDWVANTGSELFDSYINDDPELTLLIEGKLEEAIKKNADENTAEYKIEMDNLAEVYW